MKSVSSNVSYKRTKSLTQPRYDVFFRVASIPALIHRVSLLAPLRVAGAHSASSREQCAVGCERQRPVSTSRSKMAVSVFPGVRLLSIGDANGDIQRHSEQQPLRLEIKSTQDAALINLSNGELTFSFCRCRSASL